MLEEAEVRDVLRTGTLDEESADALMATLASWVNETARHDLGRECVIRVLAIRSALPAYHDQLLESLIRATGLLPYAGKPASIEEEILRTAHAVPDLGKGEVFHSLQLQVYRLLLAGRNVVLSATTSVGKSLVVDAIVASGRFRKVVVVVPTIALIDETRRRLSGRFGRTHAIITHPTQVAARGRPAVFVLTQERVLSRPDLDGVDFFVVDEFYKLNLEGGGDRAVDLNLAFHRLAASGAKFYLIGPHVSEVRGIAERHDHVFIPSTFSTVALDVVHFDLPMRGEDRMGKLLELVRGLATPTLVYCQSPAKCSEVAHELLRSGIFLPTSGTSEVVDWLEMEFPSEWIVIRALRNGIGIHHGNVPRAIQQHMIRAFEAGAVKVLLCTSTLIEGVNTVAENVIVYDRRLNTSTIDHFTFRNIAGRAGRMNRWFVGKVFVLETPPEPDHVAVELPVERQDDRTPMSLLLHLSDRDLSDGSRRRVQAAVQQTSLSLSTLQANRHIAIGSQSGIADAIRASAPLRTLLDWHGRPDFGQLSAACQLIFDHIDQGRSLKGYHVFDGPQLAAVLTKLASGPIKSFVAGRVADRRPTETVSDSVETSLRFMRKYVGHAFSRHLMAVQFIHRDVTSRMGRSPTADYGFYAAWAESLFMEAGLAALDEYGVPPQTARRLGIRHRGLDTLDKALDLIAGLRLEAQELHDFERRILSDLAVDVASSASRGPSPDR